MSRRDHPGVGKVPSGKGPRTKRARRRLSGIEAQQRKADLDRKRSLGDTRKALDGITLTWPQGRGGPQ